MDKIEKYRSVLSHFEWLTGELSKSEVIKDQSMYTRLAKERSELREAASSIAGFLDMKKRFDEDIEVIESSDDRELVELAKAEAEELKAEMSKLSEEIQFLLLPSDPDDSRNTVFEIRAGTGGDEATLFAADLARMYKMYAERHGWKVEHLSGSPSEIGGYKEVVFLISGKNAYTHLLPHSTDCIQGPGRQFAEHKHGITEGEVMINEFLVFGQNRLSFTFWFQEAINCLKVHLTHFFGDV